MSGNEDEKDNKILDLSIEELESEPHLDLADRYNQMIERQVSNLWNIDTKAWRAARLIGIIIGVFLTAISVLSGGSGANSDVSIGLVSAAVLALGILLLLFSLFLAMVSILNVEAGFGPNTKLAEALRSEENSVDEDTYPAFVSLALSKSVKMNNDVMGNKASYLRYTFATLYSGIVLLITGVSIVLLQLPPREVAVFLGASAIVCLVSGDFIINEKYDQPSKDGSQGDSGEQG